MTTNSKQIGVRLHDEDYELLSAVSQARGENLSTFLRRAMRRELARLSYLTPEEKKALEVSVKEVK